MKTTRRLIASVLVTALIILPSCTAQDRYPETFWGQDVMPGVTNLYNLGSSAYRWLNAYIKNIYSDSVTTNSLTMNGTTIYDIGNMTGPQGPQGNPGINGTNGSQGIPGPNLLDTTTNTTQTGIPVGNGANFTFIPDNSANWNTAYSQRLISASGSAPLTLTLNSNALTGSVDLSAYATLASPTFTGTPILPSPFTIGAISMTATGTQLNYLNAATGTTGTTSSNLVFSASPAFTGNLTVGAGDIKLTNWLLKDAGATYGIDLRDINDSSAGYLRASTIRGTIFAGNGNGAAIQPANTGGYYMVFNAPNNNGLVEVARLAGLASTATPYLKLTTSPMFATSTTGLGTALLSTNCPAVTATAPYTWLTVLSSDGSTCYIPAWK